MPQFNDHIEQAWHNLKFLEIVNKTDYSYFDWQVTICFYTAVHLINAHLSLYKMQYRKHVDVKDALNPFSQESQANGTTLPNQEYLAYVKLQSLSRRSRYLVNEKNSNDKNDIAPHLTYSVHLKKALIHLNTLVKYLCEVHNTRIQKIYFKCPEIESIDCVFIQTRL